MSAAPSRSFGSVGVAMVTPFTPSGEVDFDAARALAVSLVDDGADLILLSGTTGESPTTHTPEKQELIRQVKDALAGRAMVMAGAGSNDTAHAVRIGVASQEAGAEGLLINAPYYNRPSQEGVYRHINAIVEATDLPVMVYDIPGRTGVKITEDTLARLAENPRVKAVKDATGDVEQGFRRMESTGLEYYSGDDGLNFAWLTHGASGVISVAATDPSRDGGYGTFSSAGPRSGDSGLRPGVAAPGVNISSAAVGSGNDAKPQSGTSMATPQVAGVAALAVQAHPGWNAQEISSALVSTADPGKVSGYSPTRGGGLIDPAEATSAQVLAFGDSTDIDDKVVRDPVLSFGYHESNDTFQETRTITLVNKGSMSHSIDFHAGVLPPDDVMRSINPGESLVYEFTAQRAGIWLYHCSTAPMSVHLASGMHGAVIIDPPNLTAVDREYVVVQSEIYLGPEGGQTDAVKVAAKTPDLFAFNGIAFQYRDRPFTARPGERVRFWVLDAGPSEPMSFHAVGLQFDQVFFEGAWTLGGPDRIGAAWSGGSQALGLHPAQGGFVECVPPAAGTYTVVSHSFADMEKGAMGHLVVAD